MQAAVLTLKDKTTLEGVLVAEDEKFITLKLASGYNIGIDKKKVTKKVLKPFKQKIAKKAKVSFGKGKPFTILHTGGTIASKVDYETGAVNAKFSPEELLQLYPELAKIGKPKAVLIENMMSDNMRVTQYNKLIKAVEKEVKSGAKGIVITHGTDTLHYTAAALSFALENPPIPIVLTGSQRSSDRPSSDSASNLYCAAKYAVKGKKGVVVCMHGSSSDEACLIHSGLHARKMHTSRRDAFQSINSIPIANVTFDGKISYFTEEAENKGAFSTTLFQDKKVAIVKLHPSMHADMLTALKGYDGIILEGTGLGHAPIISQDSKDKENTNIQNAIKQLAKSMPVVMTSQCLHGRINMNVYSPGRTLQSIGVIGNHLDMTPEVAYIKLLWLLSNHDKAAAKKLFEENLRGEIRSYSEQVDYGL